MSRIRLLRAFLTLTTLAVVWLVTSPALASTIHASSLSAVSSMALPPPPAPVPTSQKAPLCDPRGAITFAPPPQMQDAEVSLDTGLTLDDCMSSKAAGEVRHAAPGRAPLPLDASASTDAAVLSAVAPLAAAARELLPVPAASTECPRPGVRSTVDRPPRA